MEQSEGFKNVVETIKMLEQKISLCFMEMKEMEKSAEEVEKVIGNFSFILFTVLFYLFVY